MNDLLLFVWSKDSKKNRKTGKDRENLGIIVVCERFSEH